VVVSSATVVVVVSPATVVVEVCRAAVWVATAAAVVDVAALCWGLLVLIMRSVAATAATRTAASTAQVLPWDGSNRLINLCSGGGA